MTRIEGILYAPVGLLHSFILHSIFKIYGEPKTTTTIKTQQINKGDRCGSKHIV